MKLTVEILNFFSKCLYFAGYKYICKLESYVLFNNVKLNASILVLNLISNNPNTDIDFMYATKGNGT